MENRKTRKCLRAGILFVLVFVIGLLVQTGQVLAVEVPQGSYTPEGSYLTYTFTGDSNGFYANVESYNSRAIVNGTLTIPATINYTKGTGDNNQNQDNKAPDDTQVNQVRVKGILRRAFNGCTSLQTLVLPDSITYIGQEAFANCTNLEIGRAHV